MANRLPKKHRAMEVLGEKGGGVSISLTEEMKGMDWGINYFKVTDAHF
jgi:hypothetical protein